jgi:hypothetical protein
MLYFILQVWKDLSALNGTGATIRRLFVSLEDTALKRESFGREVLANPHSPHFLFTGYRFEKREFWKRGVLANPHSPHFLFTGYRGITVKVSSVRSARIGH